jgi:hypothetical protein
VMFKEELCDSIAYINVEGSIATVVHGNGDIPWSSGLMMPW